MKQTLFILALITSTIQTFAQSPRIKLNQITKDSLTGSVLISSPTDSGMVYSRDLFISYGADTVLILGGDTLAATSGIISSVLSDGVTITGDGTTGSELTVDTATVIATKGDLSDYVTIAGTETITGAKTFTSALTQSGGDVNFDSGTLFVDQSENRVGIGITTPEQQFDIYTSDADPTTTLQIRVNRTGYGNVRAKLKTYAGGSTSTDRFTIDMGSDEFSILSNGKVGIGTTSPNYKLEVNGTNGSISILGSGFTVNPTSMLLGLYTSDRGYIQVPNQGQLDIWNGGTSAIVQFKNNLNSIFFGDVGIGETSPSEKLEVNGKVKISDLTGTGGNAVYENGGVLGVASDGRFKSHIADLDNGIEKILNLKPKYFIDNRNSAFQQLGFYAQEVKSVINEASYPIGNTDYLGINDRAIIAVTVKAIQEQQAIIQSQATEIETLKSQIQLILSEIEQIKNN